MKTWVDVLDFQLDDFSTVAEFIKFLKQKVKLFENEYLEFRVVGYGSRECLQGQIEVNVPQDNKNDTEYATYLRLKEKFETPQK
jgi:hypothetical protein